MMAKLHSLESLVRSIAIFDEDSGLTISQILILRVKPFTGQYLYITVFWLCLRLPEDSAYEVKLHLNARYAKDM
jgi:hypothetical protein